MVNKMNNLTFKEYILIIEANESRERRDDLTYIEKEVKNKLDRVIVELTGVESGVFTKLASKFDRLDKAIKLMGEKRTELNYQIKEKVEDLFAVEDVILTRVIETVTFTMTVSKKQKQDDKVNIDYKSIYEELIKIIPDDLISKIEEITKTYTTIKKQEDKSPMLTVKSKVIESLIGDLGTNIAFLIKSVIKSITSWAKIYDRKLNILKKQIK